MQRQSCTKKQPQKLTIFHVNWFWFKNFIRQKWRYGEIGIFQRSRCKNWTSWETQLSSMDLLGAFDVFYWDLVVMRRCGATTGTAVVRLPTRCYFDSS